MDLRIRHYKGDEETFELWNDHSLKDAKDTVCQWVRDGIVDHVEILDAKDELIFYYPQELGDA